MGEKRQLSQKDRTSADVVDFLSSSFFLGGVEGGWGKKNQMLILCRCEAVSIVLYVSNLAAVSKKSQSVSVFTQARSRRCRLANGQTFRDRQTDGIVTSVPYRCIL